MMHVASDVLKVCFKCFTWMLHMLQACLSVCCKVFYLYVTYVCNSFQFVILKCFIYLFYMLQALYLDV
jgi:hypothetical protein